MEIGKAARRGIGFSAVLGAANLMTRKVYLARPEKVLLARKAEQRYDCAGGKSPPDHGENFFLVSKTAGDEVPQAV